LFTFNDKKLLESSHVHFHSSTVNRFGLRKFETVLHPLQIELNFISTISSLTFMVALS